MRPTLSALVRAVLLSESVDPQDKDEDEHSLHDRAHRIAQRMEDPATLAAASSPETMIGRGGNATVHEIPGEEDLVLRVLKRGASAERDDPSARRVPNPYGDMNVGQPLASVGHATVLLRQRGEPASMSRTELIFKSGDWAETFRARVEMAGRMPQSAYDRLFAEISRLNQVGRITDPSKANNFLIDEAGGRFNIVDVITRHHGKFDSVSNTITCLTGTPFDRLSGIPVDELQGARRNIVLRSIRAGIKAGVPIFHSVPHTEDTRLPQEVAAAGLRPSVLPSSNEIPKYISDEIAEAERRGEDQNRRHSAWLSGPEMVKYRSDVAAWRSLKAADPSFSDPLPQFPKNPDETDYGSF